MESDQVADVLNTFFPTVVLRAAHAQAATTSTITPTCFATVFQLPIPASRECDRGRELRTERAPPVD